MWQQLYESLNEPNFEIMSVAEDSQGEVAAGPWFDKANATYRCVIDETHKISTLFGWVNVPSAAWIDEEGRIVRMNEGAYAGEHHVKNLLFSVKFGSTAFGEATRDWVKKGAESEFVWSPEEVRERLKPISDSTKRADPTFKLGLYFQNQGKAEKAAYYFSEAQRLAPANWNYHRQGWTFKGQRFAMKQWRKKTNAMGADQRYYDEMDLPGAPNVRVTKIDFFWTVAARKIRRFFHYFAGTSSH